MLRCISADRPTDEYNTRFIHLPRYVRSQPPELCPQKPPRLGRYKVCGRDSVCHVSHSHAAPAGPRCSPSEAAPERNSIHPSPPTSLPPACRLPQLPRYTPLRQRIARPTSCGPRKSRQIQLAVKNTAASRHPGSLFGQFSSHGHGAVAALFILFAILSRLWTPALLTDCL